MKKVLFTLFTLCLLLDPAWGQTTSTVSSGGTGWKRIASSQGGAGRGFGKVTLYTAGGTFTPSALTIDWFHDWNVSGGITLRSDSKNFPYWSAARLTDDGTNSYIEVNFTTSVTGLILVSDSYGWRPATLYTGTLPDGGGTVRAAANVGRLNIENNFVVNQNGRVGIGTTNPQAKLAVNGNILAKEIKVKTDISVPDYVFEPGYKVLSLAEIESYVKEHKHLPEVPSAKEIGEEGLDLAEMNLALLKKVEEQTLHLIELQKTINKLIGNQEILQKEMNILKGNSDK